MPIIDLQEKTQIEETNVATCGTCDSNKLEFIQIIQVGEKEIQGSIPIIAKGGYKRVILRSVHRCTNCGRVTTYHVNEA